MLSPAFIEQVNRLGAARIPFLFLIDFEMEKPFVARLDEIKSDEIRFNFNGLSNHSEVRKITRHPVIQSLPEPLSVYQKKFNLVKQHLDYGDSFLTNLTVRTAIQCDMTLAQLFDVSAAKYKLMYRDQFLCFSPETFVQIKEGRIFTYPMKGTIDASIPNAKEKLLRDTKETAEHVTIVDLLRNDLSIVAKQVQVRKFRFIDEIKAIDKTLLQVSSEIVGLLDKGYCSTLGDILAALLPAGSISGAPKRRTVEIIRAAEGVIRGYYTGVAGIFNGETLDSGVMIRFIEKNGERLYYRSGGGITTQSVLTSEYQETIDKIYVPVN